MPKAQSPGPIKTGRPRLPANQGKKRFYETALYKLLQPVFPQHAKNDRLSPTRLAAALKMHKFTVYKWLGNNKISPDGAAAVIKESKGKLTQSDLAPFVIS